MIKFTQQYFTNYSTQFLHFKHLDIMESVITTLLPIIVAVIALVVSVKTMINANKHNRQQILVGKIEEIYEIVTELHYYYSPLISVFNNLQEAHNSKRSKEQRSASLDQYHELVEELKSRNDIELLYNKTSRLNVLASTYLKGEIQLKCLAYNDLFEKLMAVVLQKQMMLKQMFFSEGFPENMVLHKYLESIQDELVRLNQLGGNSVSKDVLSKYRNSNFKTDLKLKK